MRTWDIGIRIIDNIEWRDTAEASDQIAAALAHHLTKAGIKLATGKNGAPAIAVVSDPNQPLESNLGVAVAAFAMVGMNAPTDAERLRPLAENLAAVSIAWQLGISLTTAQRRMKAGEYGAELGATWFQLAAMVERSISQGVDKWLGHDTEGSQIV